MSRFFLGCVGVVAMLGSWVAQAEATLPVFEDTMAQRLMACTGCHGKQGRAGPDGYYPRLAGKPAGYLFNQLKNFKLGRRHYAYMGNLLEPLSDAYLRDIAEYFSGLDVPYAVSASSGTSGSALSRGRELTEKGDPVRDIPACSRCHGTRLMGVAPFVPGLLGLPKDYLNAQLGAWRSGERRAVAPDCMAQIAHNLGGEDVAALVAWLSIQPVPSDTKPALSMLQEMPLKCGSTQAQWMSTGRNP